jgi:hypothetical protein
MDADVMQHVRTIYSLGNVQTNPQVLRETARLVFYLAEFHDDRSRKLLGIRRATQFKGVLRARNRLVSLVDDSLKLVDEDVFRLDQEFDFIVTSRQVLILRPSSFGYIAGIEQAAADAAIDGTREIERTLASSTFPTSLAL